MSKKKKLFDLRARITDNADKTNIYYKVLFTSPIAKEKLLF
jgi:hypothetical protein